MLALDGNGGRCARVHDQGDHAPHDQDDDHDGRDLHDAQCLFAGFVYALGVLPPEEPGHQHCECSRKVALLGIGHVEGVTISGG